VIWNVVRDRMIDAFGEVVQALTECKTEEDLLLVLELVERYPELARHEVRSPLPTARRIEAMRAAVHNMRASVDPGRKKA